MKIDWGLMVSIFTLIVTSIILCITIYGEKRHLLITFGKNSSQDSQSPLYVIKVINRGKTSITLDEISIISSYGLNIPASLSNPSNDHLPITLDVGKNLIAIVEDVDMKKNVDKLIQNKYSGKIKLIAEVKDNTKKIYRAKKTIVINLDEYI